MNVSINQLGKRIWSTVSMLALAFAVTAGFSSTTSAADYTVVFKTGTESGAGTDSNIQVKIENEDGQSTDWVKANQLISGNAFENNSRDAIAFSDDVGKKPAKVTIKSDGSYPGADWYLEFVEVTVETTRVIEGEVFDKKYVVNFPVQQWIGEGEKVLLTGAKYTVKIATDSHKATIFKVEQAGTDSNIDLNIIGENGETGFRRLNPMINGNAFEANRTDYVTFSAFDVGKIKKIQVRSDGSYAGADWLPSFVEVSKNGRDTVKFPINKWIKKGTYDF